MTQYARLNVLGMKLGPATRALCGNMAATLRTLHKQHASDDGEDDFLEIADQLDTLAAPIVVAPKKRKL